MRKKSDTFDVFHTLCLHMQRENGAIIGKIVRIPRDHGREFKNSKFCTSKGIKHELTTPITPQQNDIVARKNRTLEKMVRAMLHACNIS